MYRLLIGNVIPLATLYPLILIVGRSTYLVQCLYPVNAPLPGIATGQRIDKMSLFVPWTIKLRVALRRDNWGMFYVDCTY